MCSKFIPSKADYFNENKRHHALEIFSGTKFFEHTYWQLWRMTLVGGLWRPTTASLPKDWLMPSPPTFAGTEHRTECSGRSRCSEPSDPCTSTSSRPGKKWQCIKNCIYDCLRDFRLLCLLVRSFYSRPICTNRSRLPPISYWKGVSGLFWVLVVLILFS